MKRTIFGVIAVGLAISTVLAIAGPSNASRTEAAQTQDFIVNCEKNSLNMTIYTVTDTEYDIEYIIFKTSHGVASQIREKNPND